MEENKIASLPEAQKKSKKILKIFGYVLGIVFLISLGAFGFWFYQEKVTPKSVSPVVPVSHSLQYEIFSNSRYGYTLEYPKGWVVQVLWTTDSPPSPMATNQMVRFIAPDGEYIHVDVWEGVESSLEEWYQEYEVPRLTWVAPPKSPNIRIAGEEGFITVDPAGEGMPAQVVTTFLKKGHIIQIEYTPTQGGSQLDVFHHALETFEFGKKSTEDIIPEIRAEELKVAVPVDWKTYKNEIYGFSIKYPEKIKLSNMPQFSLIEVGEQQIEHGPRIGIGVPNSGLVFIMIEIFENREKTSIQEWWNENFILIYGKPSGNEIKATKDNFSLTETTLDNHQGILVVPNKKISESLRYVGSNYLISSASKIFSIRLFSEDYGSQIFSTFKFLE